VVGGWGWRSCSKIGCLNRATGDVQGLSVRGIVCVDGTGMGVMGGGGGGGGDGGEGAGEGGGVVQSGSEEGRRGRGGLAR